MVTTLVDALGTSQAAEYTSRTIKTIETYYKRKRAATQARTTAVLDDIQRDAAKLPPNHNPNRNEGRKGRG